MKAAKNSNSTSNSRLRRAEKIICQTTSEAQSHWSPWGFIPVQAEWRRSNTLTFQWVQVRLRWAYGRRCHGPVGRKSLSGTGRASLFQPTGRRHDWMSPKWSQSEEWVRVSTVMGKGEKKKLRVSDTAADRSYTGSKIKSVFRQKTAASISGLNRWGPEKTLKNCKSNLSLYVSRDKSSLINTLFVYHA